MSVSSFIDRFSELAAAGVLASIGGAAQALYQLHKGEKPFSILSFSICVALSFFVGQVVGSFIPASLEHYHDGLLLMSGFCVFPILDLINVRMAGVFSKMLDRAVPEAKTDDKQP